ncbi:hypothetical protein [Tigheibacillus jepli]
MKNFLEDNGLAFANTIILDTPGYKQQYVVGREEAIASSSLLSKYGYLVNSGSDA